MKRKIILSLSFLTVFLTLLWSCHSEDFIPQEDASQLSAKNVSSAKFVSRSLWKEDVLYIDKVQQVFLKHANLERFNTYYGELHWDYAMSYGQFGEKYALVPITKKNKVVLLMEAVRIGNKVYFYEKKDENLQTFFEQVMYSNIVGFEEKINTQGSPSAKGLSYVCSTRTIHVGCANGEVNCPPASNTTMVCEWVISNHPPKGLPPSGDPNFEGGGGSEGYEYPETPVETPCEKIVAKISDPKFKAKYQELNKPEMFAMDHEKGFYERLPPIGSNLPSGFPVVDGAPCTHGLDFPDNEDGVAGLMHIHNDNDCDGNPSIKIFSPKDVRTFLNKLMKQARIYSGSYTNASSTVITSQGSYMLQYTNDTWPGSTWDKIDDWNNWYTKEYEKLIRDDQFTQSNVEKVFTQFLKEKVGIDGLEVFKITENSSSKLEYNGTNQPVKATPCTQ